MIYQSLAFQPSDGTVPQKALGTVYVDTASDLPAIADFTLCTPVCGFRCITSDTGAEYIMDSGGTWHEISKSPFSDVYTKGETDAIIAALDAPSVGGTGSYIMRISETDGIISAAVGTLDTVPASGSDNPVTSGGVYQALSEQVGIGIEFGSSAYDLDNYMTPGIWRSTGSGMTANGSHVPAPIQTPNQRRGFRLEVKATSTSDYVTQIVYPAWNANLPSTYYIRHYRGTTSPPTGGWSNWYEYSGTDTGS